MFATLAAQASMAAPTKVVVVLFDANTLIVKDTEEMKKIVNRQIAKARQFQAEQELDYDSDFLAEPQALDALKAGTRIALGRPDHDGTLETVFSNLRRELTDLNSFEKVMSELTQEAIIALRSPKSPLRHKATYVVMLENLMAQLKPEISKKDEFRKIVEDIKNANLELSDDLKVRQLLRSMSTPVTPSATAAKILAQYPAVAKN